MPSDLLGMLKSVTSKGVNFIRRQHTAFKVNIARNLISKFSIGLTQQYQSIYVSALGAGVVELGLVSSVGGVASTIFMIPVGARMRSATNIRFGVGMPGGSI